jgi:hypothetical protein
MKIIVKLAIKTAKKDQTRGNEDCGATSARLRNSLSQLLLSPLQLLSVKNPQITNILLIASTMHIDFIIVNVSGVAPS